MVVAFIMVEVTPWLRYCFSLKLLDYVAVFDVKIKYRNKEYGLWSPKIEIYFLCLSRILNLQPAILLSALIKQRLVFLRQRALTTIQHAFSSS